MKPRAIALIDGEHYAPVVRDALASLPYAVVGALLVGGTEKLRGGEDYGVPLVEALDAVEADLVVDLSDEPVLGPRERLLWASRALALRLPYVGADFRFDPPPLEPVDVPSLAVIGLGKRIGKTAVAGHVARVLAADQDRADPFVRERRERIPHDLGIVLAVDERHRTRAGHRRALTSRSILPVYFSYSPVRRSNWMISS